MASILKVDKLDPQSGTALEIGTSRDTVTVPSGATLDISSATLTPPATMPASSGVNLTALNATQLTSGTVPDARFPATLPAASGVNLTALNATNLGSGTVPTARLGTGTASSSTVLYGDQTYKAEPGGGKIGQVVSSTRVTRYQSNSTGYTDFWNASLTPSATSSKILILVDWNYSGNNSDIYGKGFLDYEIGGTGGYSYVVIGEGSLGSRTPCTFTVDSGFSSNPGDHMYNCSYSYLASFSTTSEVNIRFGGYYPSSAHWLGINQTATDSDGSPTPSSTSSITLMEVLA